MQNVSKNRGDIKPVALTPTLYMRISPIALGISAADMAGLSHKDAAVRLRRAANTLLSVALSLDGKP